MRKKVSIILCFAIAIFAGFVGRINALLPNSITGVVTPKVLKFNGNDQLLYKTYNNGVVFCTSFHVQGVGSSCKLSDSQWSQPTQAGVAAVITKYNSSPSEKNYYDAELAINEFLYYYETKDANNKISSSRDVRNTNGVKAFYDEAVKAYNDAKAKFDINLIASGNKISFKLEGENYISNMITVDGVKKYDVSISGVDKAEVYNQQGNNFYIKIPLKSLNDGSTVTVKVTVKASKTVIITKKYDCGSGNQSVALDKTESTVLNASKEINGTITPDKKVTKVKISKQDITTKEELPGATLILRDESGKEIDKWVSGKEPHYIENLPAGKYTLTEMIAPEGYKLSEDTIEFTLEANNEIKTVIMYNSHESKYVVKISKQDITTKKELPGATLVLKDANGKEIERWVSGEEPHYLELPKGDYILTEVQAPNGYDLSYEVVKFSVGDQGEVETMVVMYNSKTPDTSDKSIFLIAFAMLVASCGVLISIKKLKGQK